MGALWAFWHLPLFYMPGMPQHGTPFLSYVPYVIALSVLLTILAMNTDGSVIIAILFHGAVNTFAIVNEGASTTQRGWGNAVSYGVPAATIGAIAWTAPLAKGRRAA
jgi:membrane protease YdiL (CAAX protease family)